MSNLIYSDHSSLSSNTRSIKTTCAYCGVGCGIEIVTDTQSGIVQLKGDNHHPANYGRLCSKGSALSETLDEASRLLFPEVFGKRTDWQTAISTVADSLKNIIHEHGPDSVAFYGSGQLLTEDYYVINKLMKGFIGSANLDTNSRLCMASSVAGHKRAFGSDTVPACYDDLDHARLIILIGANSAWCHPVLFQRITQAKQTNPELKIVVIDPRKTTTCDIADLHLPIRSGTDAYLFNGLLCYLADQQCLDQNYIDRFTNGFEETLVQARAQHNSLASTAALCGLDSDSLRTFYSWYADTAEVMSLYSQGINQSSSGTDKVNAIINCHLATGRIGKPGAGPLSLTGQPNAMGGREVGGLANQLAAHLGFTEKERELAVRFWGNERVASKPGLTAVELFDAVAAGKVKAVWVMATNPVFSLPNADKVKQALAQCDLLIVSDCVAHTDTLDLAHIKLPAAGWSEKDGTVTNSERRISRQRAFKPLSGEAKPDWWIVSEVAKAMGYTEQFNYQSAADIFREHARFSAFENDEQGILRDFNLSALCDLSDAQYNALEPVQWPVTQTHPEGTRRLFSEGGFFTPNRKAKFIPVTARKPVAPLSASYPLILNTGRIRDQWHSMSRTALSPRLNLHKPEPFLEMHPEDARTFSLCQGELAVIHSEWGSMLARVSVSDCILQGMVFVPMHWTQQLSAKGRMGAVVNPFTDPFSFQPESKHTPVRVSPFDCQWQGFVVSRYPLNLQTLDYRVDIKGDQCYRYEIADQSVTLEGLEKLILEQLKTQISFSLQRHEDPASALLRIACFKDDQLILVCMIQKDSHLPERDWLTGIISRGESTRTFRTTVLSGKPPVGSVDTGKQICACFNVGEKTLKSLIASKQATSVEAIGKACKAGTNCGACIPELKALLG
jgi:assimilatory nitrate reductase catalytic subunit